MAIQIDNVGMAAFVCSRGQYQPKTSERTFKARCGSYIRFTVTVGPMILHIRKEHNACAKGCPLCEEQIATAKNLIQSGK